MSDPYHTYRRPSDVGYLSSQAFVGPTSGKRIRPTSTVLHPALILRPSSVRHQSAERRTDCSFVDKECSVGVIDFRLPGCARAVGLSQ